MSSILLNKDHNGQKANTVISVPHGVGKSLIAAGIGRWFDSTKENLPEPGAEFHPARPEVARVMPRETMASEGGMPIKPEFPPQPQPQPQPDKHKK